MKLRNYQERTINMIKEELRKGHKKILVVLPCGAGKSIIMGFISKMCTDKGNKVLSLMHRRGLVHQLTDRFASCGVESGKIMSQEDAELSKSVQAATIQTYSRRIELTESDWDGNVSKPWMHDADVICIDECVSPDTEILTHTGWKLIKNLNSEKVAQYDLSTRSINFVLPTKKIAKKYQGKMYNFTVNGLDLCGTENHLQPVFKPKSTTKDSFKNWRPNRYQKIPCAGFGKGKRKFTCFDQFLIALAADGYVIPKKPKGKQMLRFKFSKKRKIDRLIEILEKCGYAYKEQKPEKAIGNRKKVRVFRVYYPFEVKAKGLRFIANLNEISWQYAKSFIEEIIQWDGTIYKGCIKWCGTDKKDADYIQAVCALGGIWSSVRTDKRPPYKDLKTIAISFRDTHHCGSIKKHKFDYNGMVYCVRVPKGNIVVRRNNKVAVTGNCHRALSKTFQGTLKKYGSKVVLGFTATPVLSNGSGMNNYFESLIQPTNVQELIDLKKLVPGEYYGLDTPDLTGIKTVKGDYEQKELGKRYNNSKLVGDVVKNWNAIAYGKKTLLFAVNVQHSKALVHEFNKLGVPAEHLDAKSPDEKRQETIDRLITGETMIVSNVGLFTEGTDIPEVECIDLAFSTKNIGKYLQVVGRGARPYPGKDSFIVLDHGGNVNTHGYYEEPITWTLEGKKISYKKHKPVEPKKKFKMNCEKCRTVFNGDTCPRCGTKIIHYGKKIEALEADLKRLTEKKSREKGSQFKKMRSTILIGMLVHEAKRLKKTDSWIRAQYMSITERWPQSINVRPIPATKELKSYLTYLRIKYIKSRRESE